MWHFDSSGGADQTPVVVGKVAPPCSPSGLTFGSDGRLYITGAGAAGDQIAVLAPDSNAPPTATIFATGTPGANGVAFDGAGNLYASDGGTNQGRVFRVGPAGGAAAELFRVPPTTNSVGVGRVNSTAQPAPTAANPQLIAANGLAFTEDGALLVADTSRGALWRVDLDGGGNVVSPTGCDSTYADDALCVENVFVQNPSSRAPTGSRSTARATCGSTRTSGTRS